MDTNGASGQRTILLKHYDAVVSFKALGIQLFSGATVEPLIAVHPNILFSAYGDIQTLKDH